MRTIGLLVRRELRSYFDTAWGWTILAMVLILDGLMFNAFALGTRERYSAEVLSDFFYLSSGTTMIAGVLLTMRLIAEERQTGTMVGVRVCRRQQIQQEARRWMLSPPMLMRSRRPVVASSRAPSNPS